MFKLHSEGFLEEPVELAGGSNSLEPESSHAIVS